MKKIIVFISLIICFMSVLSGCDIFGGVTTLEISGYVYLDTNQPLSDVAIKSETNIYAKTDDNGYFNITVQKSKIELFAEKTGYSFSPYSVEITENTDNLIFVATKTKDLSGLLTLSHIIITPTSMVSFGDNYAYQHNGEKCLKINDLEVNIDDKSFDLLDSDFYAVEDKSNVIAINDDITIKTDYDFNIWFSLDAYFTSYNEEFIFHEDRQSVIRVQEKQTTEDLNDQNQVLYTAYGVNASNNMFTYNITFVFDYYENI